MINNDKRTGNATSSEIFNLMSDGRKAREPGKPFYTYIEECNWERALGKSIQSDTNARPTSWGSLCEKYVSANLLGTDYKLCYNQTLVHPLIDSWAGSPDVIKFDEGGTVGDLKSPFTLKSFCQLVEPLLLNMKEIAGVWQYDGNVVMDAIRNGYTDAKGIPHDKHKDGEKYYWQLISNAILTKSKYAELIIFVPYKEELESIAELAANIDDPIEQTNFYWIHKTIMDGRIDELPYLIKGGKYSNLNIIRFEVSEEDKIALTTRVGIANKLLIKR